MQFFIVAMRRLRRGAELGVRASGQRDTLQSAIHAFDEALPDLLLLRNVGEHVDEYAVGAGYESSVRWRQLQVGGWDGTTFKWLDIELNAEDALKAGRQLVGELELARARQMKVANI